MSEQPSLSEARNDLRVALTQEVEQLEKDIYRCSQLKRLVLAGDLSRIRTRINALLAALDRTEIRELRRDDYAPREAA